MIGLSKKEENKYRNGPVRALGSGVPTLGQDWIGLKGNGKGLSYLYTGHSNYFEEKENIFEKHTMVLVSLAVIEKNQCRGTVVLGTLLT